MRLLTYNIHKGIGGRDRSYQLDRVLDVIEDQNPDLIFLQEVDRGVRRSRFHDQPKMMHEFFNAADSMYQLNVKLKTGGYGNLLLSRWPIVKRHQISLRYGWKKQRGGQLAVVDSPEGALHVVNWHLGLAEIERSWQARHLLSHRLFQESADLPTLIAGDTNDWRNALEPTVFGSEGFVEVTRPPSRHRTFPAYLPVGSLDKVFMRGPLEVAHKHVIRTQLSKEASDHLPLVVDFHVSNHGTAHAIADRS